MKKHRFLMGYVVGLASFGIINQVSLWEAPGWMLVIAVIVVAYIAAEVWNRVEA